MNGKQFIEYVRTLLEERDKKITDTGIIIQIRKMSKDALKTLVSENES